jgi:hypothetical protein
LFVALLGKSQPLAVIDRVDAGENTHPLVLPAAGGPAIHHNHSFAVLSLL